METKDENGELSTVKVGNC